MNAKRMGISELATGVRVRLGPAGEVTTDILYSKKQEQNSSKRGEYAFRIIAREPEREFWLRFTETGGINGISLEEKAVGMPSRILVEDCHDTEWSPFINALRGTRVSPLSVLCTALDKLRRDTIWSLSGTPVAQMPEIVNRLTRIDMAAGIASEGWLKGMKSVARSV